jgi:predicted ester cyclase
MIAERNEVVLHWTARGTHQGQFLGMAPTNKSATVTGTSIYKLEKDKIVEQWSDWNLLSLLEQLGLAKAVNANLAKAPSRAGS